MLLTIVTTGFSTKNGLFTVGAAIGAYTALLGGVWLIWLIRIYLYQSKIITKLNTDYDSQTDELNSAKEQIVKLNDQNKQLEKANSDLRSEIKQITTNRDTLINMNNDLKNENNALNGNYQLLWMALFSAAISNNHIQKFINTFNNNKEFIDGTKGISHSKDNQ